MHKTKRLLPYGLAIILISASSAAIGAPIRLRSETVIPPPKNARPLAPATAAPGAGVYYLVQFQGPVTEEWKTAVKSLGVRLGEYVADYGFVARMTSAQAERVISLDCVSAVERLAPRHRLHGALKTVMQPYVEVMIKLFPDETSDEVRKAIARNGGSIVAESASGAIYLRAIVSAGSLDRISQVESVEWIEEWRQPRVSNNVAQEIVGIRDKVGAPGFRTRAGFYGDGEIVAVADTGLDTGDTETLSSDFSGRLVMAYPRTGIGYPYGEVNTWNDLYAHGTHVLGIMTGSGVLSGSNPLTHSYNTSYAGIAPEASYVVQAIGDSNGAIHTPFLAELFGPAYSQGARIHNNSWGFTPTEPGQYTTMCQQVDDFCWTYKDFLVVFAAGNQGRDTSAAPTGVADPYTLDAPGTAKNCITVGATESIRPGMGVRTPTGEWKTTWGTAYAEDFPWTPISTDAISDTPNAIDQGRGMVAWSGRGPCQDQRIKPDICAPGTHILSCRTHATTGESNWGVLNADYQYMGGTSMAAPMVAGAAALVREYYVKSRGIVNPSSALIKATLLNGAKDIFPGQYGSGHSKQEIAGSRPNNVEGWGLLDFSSTPVPVLPRVMSFVDESAGLQTTDSHNYIYNVVGTTQPLNVTLVWTDPPSSMVTSFALVNNLDLVVTGPTGTIYRGNNTVDTTNNVESVDIPSPLVGAYTVTVSGTNVPQGPQPYALVITGLLPAGYIAGTVTTGSGAPIAGVTITATNSDSRSTSTGADGAYAVSVPPGDYTVVASKTDWTFSSHAPVTVANDPVLGVDFTGSAPSGGISGSVTQQVGGRVPYMLEPRSPYPGLAATEYIVTGHPSATQIRVHFDDIALLYDPIWGYADYVYVANPDGTIVDTYTGDASDVWSSWITGNSLKVILVPDPLYIGPGFPSFSINGYETDVIPDGPVSGVTITAQPGGATAVTLPDGTFTFSGLEPVSYSLTAALPHWKFSPDVRPAEVPPAGTAGNIDFLAYPPGSISGAVTSGTVSTQVWDQANWIQSEHNYWNASDIYYPPVEEPPIQAPAGSTWIRIHFTKVELEPGVDYVYLLDGAYSVVDYANGDYLDAWSAWIKGDSLRLRLVSDSGLTYWGFACDKIQYVTGEHGISGIPVTMPSLGMSAVSGPAGTYSIPNVDEGRFDVSVAKPYWTFVPTAYTTNVVRGVDSSGLDFRGSLGVMPSAGYVKTLTDGEEVSLAGKIITGGSDEFFDYFYVEEQDRSSGIRINNNSALATRGKTVTVSGNLGTSTNGEKQITPTGLNISTGTVTVPAPMLMTNRMLGGSSAGFDPVTMAGQRGVENGVGLNNIGLLVRIVGKVTKVGINGGGIPYCYIDDGSGAQDDSPYKGVRVDCGSMFPQPTPGDEGRYLAITGISSLMYSSGRYYRTVLPRDMWDFNFVP